MLLIFVLNASGFAGEKTNSGRTMLSGITISIGQKQIDSQSSKTIKLPLEVENFNNIGAISLKIAYDKQVLRFTGVTNIKNNINILSSDNNGVISIGWFDLSAINPLYLNNCVLLEFNFEYLSGNSDISFNKTACEINDGQGKALSIAYVDGKVTYITAVNLKHSALNEFSLGQNYPNPFNPFTKIDYTVSEESNVTLKVYNMLGSQVSLLVNERKQPGKYSVTFNAGGMPSGIYIYRLESKGNIITRRMTLMK